MKEKVLLTVDMGGSKTRLLLYTRSGVFIQSGETKGYGLAVDEITDIPEFSEFLRSFCKGFEPVRIACNLGGKNIHQIETILQSVFPSANVNIFRESHGVVGETLCEKYGAQITLMAGTGSIVVAKSKTQTVICGGWGANISDDGSGYQLGLSAVKQALKELDEGSKVSLLTKRLTGVKNPSNFQTAVEYCEFRDCVRARLAPFDRARIASFAKTVYECAKDGDEQSLKLYKTTGKELAGIVLTAMKKLGEEVSSIVVTGGLVHAKEFWSNSFEEDVKKNEKIEKIYYVADGMSEALLTLVVEK